MKPTSSYSCCTDLGHMGKESTDFNHLDCIFCGALTPLLPRKIRDSIPWVKAAVVPAAVVIAKDVSTSEGAFLITYSGFHI